MLFTVGEYNTSVVGEYWIREHHDLTHTQVLQRLPLPRGCKVQLLFFDDRGHYCFESPHAFADPYEAPCDLVGYLLSDLMLVKYICS